jgi:BirA family biotin operon repressor/biotin-[acetyl-CoA-carboxylase] ligase
LPISSSQEINICTVKSILKILQKYIEKAYFKIPNDIYVEDKKICGILIENIIFNTIIRSTVIGIGVNVNQQKVPKH